MVAPHVPGVLQAHFCCSEPQIMLLGNYILYLLACVLLWHSKSLRPLKLFTVFLHELGHAVAVWVTCGKVTGIEVHADHGGLTHWSHQSHRIRCASHLVLPAGYLGSAAWGGVILVCCARPASTYLIAMVLSIFLIIAFGYSLLGKNSRRDWTLTNLCVGMLVLIAGALCLHILTGWRIWYMLLNKVLLLVGCMNTVFATYDIWDDCVLRSEERSDACRYAELLDLRCVTGRCVGTVWLLVSLGLAASALLMALWWVPPAPVVRGPSDLHVSSSLFLILPAATLICSAVNRWPALKDAVKAAAGGRPPVRWASISQLTHQPLGEVLLKDWQRSQGKFADHDERCDSLEDPLSADVALQDLRQVDQAEEPLFQLLEEDLD
mmetsp:Transcript_61341/g.115684  ORF Transcript_61341/g.115684 Transcript_61341/m.115684 type:complete len:379 (-) Transcript_61341:63-1199(-)